MFSKFCFPFLILIFVYLFSYAQEENLKGQFDIGIQGGPQFTNISTYSLDVRMNSSTGYSIGAIVDYFLTNDLKLRVGGYFDNRRFEKYISYSSILGYDSDSTVYTGFKSYYLLQVDYSLNYITLPLSIVYQKGNEKVKVFAQLGIYYSLLLSATQNGSSDFYIDPVDAEHYINPEWSAGHHLESYEGDVSYDFNSSDFGVGFSIGCLFKISGKILASFAPGLSYGFSNVYSNPGFDSNWNQMVKLDAGLIYFLKKSKN